MVQDILNVESLARIIAFLLLGIFIRFLLWLTVMGTVTVPEVPLALNTSAR
jgi:uncharacterized membrane protein (Fun14 family)